MRNCSSCGEEVGDGVVFCGGCGAHQVAEQPIVEQPVVQQPVVEQPVGEAPPITYQHPAAQAPPAYPPPQGPAAYPPAAVAPGYQQPYGYQQPAPGYGYYEPKSKTNAAIFAAFLGMFGVHRFYLGYTGAGIGMLALLFTGIIFCVTWIALFVWVLVDFILILTGSLRDSRGQPLV